MTTVRSLTVRELVYSVRSLLGDNSNFDAASDETAGETYTDAMIVDALNHAVRQYCLITGCTYTTVKVELDTDDLDSVIVPNQITTPSDCMEVKRVMLALIPDDPEN